MRDSKSARRDSWGGGGSLTVVRTTSPRARQMLEDCLRTVQPSSTGQLHSNRHAEFPRGGHDEGQMEFPALTDPVSALRNGVSGFVRIGVGRRVADERAELEQ